jgi:hypothetical protein
VCFIRQLVVKYKGTRKVGVVADKEAYTVHTENSFSQRQCFAARCLSSCVGNVFGLHCICVCFPYTHKLETLAKGRFWSRLLYYHGILLKKLWKAKRLPSVNCRYFA